MNYPYTFKNEPRAGFDFETSVDVTEGNNAEGTVKPYPFSEPVEWQEWVNYCVLKGGVPYSQVDGKDRLSGYYKRGAVPKSQRTGVFARVWKTPK